MCALQRSMVIIPCLIVVELFGVGSASAGTGTVVPVTSTFDSSLEGWTSNVAVEVFWFATEGNPGGYAKFIDDSTNAASIIAPAPYLGDWSALENVGSIFFDHGIFQTGEFDAMSPYIVALSGPGGSARWFGPTPTGLTPWTTLTAPLLESAWAIESGTWSGLLDNVTQFSIRIELVQNTGGAREVAGIDNVMLTPEPGTVVFLGLGMATALRRRR